jgi:ribosomal protein S27AE
MERMICPYCGSGLLDYCDCCGELWCPACDRHIDTSKVKKCPKCGKNSYVPSGPYDEKWTCYECGYEGEAKE